MKLNSPLAQSFIANGYKHQINGDFITFPVYTDEEKEYRSISIGAAIRDLSGSPLLRLSGTDALDFLHRISTNAIKTLEPNQIKRTVFTNEKGRILDDANVMVFGDYILLLGNEGKNALLEFWIRRYIIMDDVKVENLYGKYGVLEVIGNQAESLMILLFGDNAKNIPFNTSRSAVYESYSFQISITKNHLGKSKYLIIGQIESIKLLVQQSTKQENFSDVVLIGDRAYEQYRIEQGLPGSEELNDNFNPHEAQLIEEVSFTKGCYIGQEVIARLATYNKVQRYRCNILFSEKIEDSILPELVSEDGLHAGIITSQIFSPKRNATIAMGYVDKNFFEDNRHLIAKIGDTEHDVIVKQLGSL